MRLVGSSQHDTTRICGLDDLVAHGAGHGGHGIAAVVGAAQVATDAHVLVHLALTDRASQAPWVIGLLIHTNALGGDGLAAAGAVLGEEAKEVVLAVQPAVSLEHTIGLANGHVAIATCQTASMVGLVRHNHLLRLRDHLVALLALLSGHHFEVRLTVWLASMLEELAFREWCLALSTDEAVPVPGSTQSGEDLWSGTRQARHAAVLLSHLASHHFLLATQTLQRKHCLVVGIAVEVAVLVVELDAVQRLVAFVAVEVLLVELRSTHSLNTNNCLHITLHTT